MNSIRLLIVAAACVALQRPALAEDFSIADDAYQPAGSAWSITVTPYGWAPGFVGDAAFRGYKLHAAASFFEVIQAANQVIPAMGYVQLQKGPFSLFADGIYAQFGFDRSDTLHFNPLAQIEIGAHAKANLILTLGIAEAGAAFEVGRWEEANGASSALDLYGGARYWNSSGDLTVKTKESIDLARFGWKRVGRRTFRITEDVDWVDPVVGLRVRQQLSPGHEVDFVGDVGGFGAGSNVSWQVYGGYTRSFQYGRAAVAASIGYRVLGVDYDGGSGKNVWQLDTIMHGPQLALSVHW